MATAIFQPNLFQANASQLDAELFGDLSAAEDISDSLAADGVLQSGDSLIAAEVSTDDIAVVGSVEISGTGTISETPAVIVIPYSAGTSTASGAVLISGTGTTTETTIDTISALGSGAAAAISGTIFMPGTNTLPPSTKKPYEYQPAPVGAVKLLTRAASRSRFTNETHYRSKDLGSVTNMIELSLVEDQSLPTPEGLFVTHHKAIVPTEMVTASLMTVPSIKLFKFDLAWDQELRVVKENGDLVAKIYGIRWQIAGGPAETLLSTLGKVTKDRVFTTPEVSFKLSAGPAEFPTGAVLFIKPRTRRYTLMATSDTDPVTSITTTGWSISALRATVAADSTGWITLPKRNSNIGDGETLMLAASNAEDQQDDGQDAMYAVPFGPVAMRGGDGLPEQPVGYNTGPERTLIHLNYSELPNGSMGILNQVFEWAGESSSVGAWQRYA